MTEIEKIKKRAKLKYIKIQKLKNDPRFIHTIGRFVKEGLLEHSHIRPWPGFISLEDALWAGKLEPRILELIPAILLKKPRIFPIVELPQDLKIILQDIRKNIAIKPFREVEHTKYLYWVERLGHKGKKPSLLKTFRMNQEDLELIKQLKETLQISEIEIIRKGIKNLALKKIS